MERKDRVYQRPPLLMELVQQVLHQRIEPVKIVLMEERLFLLVERAAELLHELLLLFVLKLPGVSVLTAPLRTSVVASSPASATASSMSTFRISCSISSESAMQVDGYKNIRLPCCRSLPERSTSESIERTLSSALRFLERSRTTR